MPLLECVVLKALVLNNIVLLDLLGPPRDQEDLRTFFTLFMLS